MATETHPGSQNLQPFTFGDDELTFFKQYIEPAWAPATTTGQTDFTSLGQDFGKELTQMDQFSFEDFGSLLQPLSDQPVISTKDIFQPPPPEPIATAPSPRTEANLAEFSSQSASPADSTPQGAEEADHASDSETDSDDQEDFIATRKASTSKGRGASRGKRSATKPKPYPRVSDVVRDAPQHKAADNKRSSASTELKGSIRTGDAIDDDWRPTLEEYQKMSSKEKRQLRNKISARNFRVRRKEYITTLEGEVASRDQQLQEYRDQLTTTKTENSELRKEIERLRQAILEGRGTTSIFEESASASPTLSSAVTPKATGRTTRSSAPRPNRNKDLPASGSARGFWGGASALGGTTPVHTTLIPDFDIVSALSGKPRPPPLQENINPLLNSIPHQESLPKTGSYLSGFDNFADTNNFTFKSLEAYRMQLWSKMARESNLATRTPVSSSSPTSSSPSSLSSSSWSNSLLGRASTNVSPLHFAPPVQTKPMDGELVPTPSQAILATSVSQNIVSKLTGAFWDAFSGRSASSIKPIPTQNSTSSERVDLDKVRKVLEGKAILQVIDVDGENLNDLDEKLQSMSLNSSSGPKSPTTRKELEEGLKNLSITSSRREPISACTSSALGIFKHPMRAGHSPAVVPSAHSPVTGPTVAAQN